MDYGFIIIIIVLAPWQLLDEFNKSDAKIQDSKVFINMFSLSLILKQHVFCEFIINAILVTAKENYQISDSICVICTACKSLTINFW